jgi:hypothetical protein
LVRCALPAGRSITKKDQNGVSYTYSGLLGFAPEWETGACGQICQDYVSACLMAHINTAGVHIPLWLTAYPANIGFTKSPAYPHQEGSFFGNLFVSPPKAYYCNGKDFDVSVVPGRIGANQTGAPYTNVYAAPLSTYCADYCTAADYPNAAGGYKACAGFNHVVTVFRQ